MKKLQAIVAFVAAAAAIATLVPADELLGVGIASAGTTGHKWKFRPTINAPWALEEDEGEIDSPLLAAGLPLCIISTKNSLAGTSRRPCGPAISSSASRARTAAGQSAAGSA
jgi:hypothetical protein